MENDITQRYDAYEDDDDELDLIKLVATNANDSNQYLVFVGSNNELYAKNVSKIEELVVYKDLTITKNSDRNNIIIGTADIRGQMTTIVNFDAWMGNEVLDDELYELLIIASYGNQRFAIIVKSVEQITTIEPSEMSDNSNDNNKATFITKVNISGTERLCTIFDGDKMLLDIYDDMEDNAHIEINDTKKVDTDKIVLFADDSKFVRKMVSTLLDKMHLNYKLYHDGRDLVDDMCNFDEKDIGLIITDLEMPKMGGREVIDHIRQDATYKDINIIVHTNMSNNITSNELINLGTSKIIGKINMEELSGAVNEFIR